MKESSKTEAIYNRNDEFTAIYLSASHTAEHEQGISVLQHHLGLQTPKVMGLEGRIIKNPKNLYLLKGKRINYLYATYFDYKKDDEQTLINQLDSNPDLVQDWRRENMFWSAWDDNSFCIATDSQKGIEYLTEIFEAAQQNNAAIWLGSNRHTIFQSSGIILAVANKLDNDVNDILQQADFNMNASQ